MRLQSQQNGHEFWVQFTPVVLCPSPVIAVGSPLGQPVQQCKKAEAARPSNTTGAQHNSMTSAFVCISPALPGCVSLYPFILQLWAVDGAIVILTYQGRGRWGPKSKAGTQQHSTTAAVVCTAGFTCTSCLCVAVPIPSDSLGQSTGAIGGRSQLDRCRWD
jgi:hypothetical protein